MKKMFLKTSSLWLIALFILFTCTEQIDPLVNEPRDEQSRLINDAKYFFENDFDPESEMYADARTTKNLRHDLAKSLKWNNAFVRQMSNSTQGVVVPVKFDEELYFTASDASLSLSKMTYILIYNNKGRNSLEIVTSMPDTTFLDSDRSEFSGTVYVENWNGVLLKSILHRDGMTSAYIPEKIDNASGRLAWCKRIIDWYTCTTNDGGETWDCRLTEIEVIWEPCDNGGGLSGGECIECYIYEPGPGGSTNPDDPNPNPDPLPDVCNDGYVLDGNGNCIKVLDPCSTGDDILDDTSFQESMDLIWAGSNAIDSSVPISSRMEQGGWIIETNGNFSFEPFPSSIISTPCGMEGEYYSIPDNLVGTVHSHPFYKGENTKSVCGKYGEKSYSGGPSRDDAYFLYQISNQLEDFTLKGYVIDGNNIHSYTGLTYATGQFETILRCGY